MDLQYKGDWDPHGRLRLQTQNYDLVLCHFSLLALMFFFYIYFKFKNSNVILQFTYFLRAFEDS